MLARAALANWPVIPSWSQWFLGAVPVLLQRLQRSRHGLGKSLQH
jgi:hypothetical protein